MFSFIKKVLRIWRIILLIAGVYFIIIGLFLVNFTHDRPKKTVDVIESNRQEIYKQINNPVFKKNKTGKIILAIYRTFACSSIGEACTNNPGDGDKNYYHSIIGSLNNLIVLPFANPPASGLYWAYSGLENVGFIPKTYAAQGIGFAALSPFMNIWKAFRDFSYMLLVLVLIAIGFMIMLRKKINPQTVISVENALPKIVIALLLITFSFPIAGFLIDLMYVIIALGISVLSYRGNFFPVNDFLNKYINADFGTIMFSMWPRSPFSALWELSKSILNILPSALNQILRSLSGAVVGVMLVRLFDSTIVHIADALGKLPEGADVEGGISIFSGGFDIQFPIIGGFLKMIIIGILVPLVFLFGFATGYSILPLILFILVLLTVIFLLFRIFFLLFSTYIKIILLVIFSPLFLLFEAVPGKSAFSWWFKTLFAEILTFPIVIVLLVTGYVIVNVTPAIGQAWQPPFLYGMNPASLTVMIGVGIVFLIPELVKLSRELMGTKGMPIGIGLGTFFAGAGAGIGGAMGLTAQFSSLMLAFPGLRRTIGGKNIPFISKMVSDQGSVPRTEGPQAGANPPPRVPPDVQPGGGGI